MRFTCGSNGVAGFAPAAMRLISSHCRLWDGSDPYLLLAAEVELDDAPGAVPGRCTAPLSSRGFTSGSYPEDVSLGADMTRRISKR